MSRSQPYRWRRGRAWLAALALAAGALLALGCLGQADEGDVWRDWSRLELKARAFPLTGRVQMTMARDDGGDVFETHTIARVFGVKIADSNTTSVLDPTTGATRSYTSRSSKRARRFVFDAGGYSATKFKPGAGEDGAVQGTGEFEGWHVVEERRFERPVDESGAALPIYDYYGMLMRLASEPLHETGDEVTLWVATNDGPMPYTIRIGEAARDEFEWTDAVTGEERRETLHAFRLRIQPADPENADEGFLDMEGETELWVEAGSKTLLHLSGKVPKVPGRVELSLDTLG